MTYPHGWGPSPPRSPPPPPHPSPTWSTDGHLPLQGNVLLMLGELVGNVRHLIFQNQQQDGQIAGLRQDVQQIQGRLADGSTVLKAHDARLTNLEVVKISRFERLAKRYLAYLMPVATALFVGWITGNADLVPDVIKALPK